MTNTDELFLRLIANLGRTSRPKGFRVVSFYQDSNADEAARSWIEGLLIGLEEKVSPGAVDAAVGEVIEGSYFPHLDSQSLTELRDHCPEIARAITACGGGPIHNPSGREPAIRVDRNA